MNNLQAGFARVNITPMRGIGIGGYFKPRYVEGVLDELEIKDVIKLIDLENKEYEYIVYDIFETTEEDLSILRSNKNYEITLLTCNNSNKKRIIVKAYMKEY